MLSRSLQLISLLLIASALRAETLRLSLDDAVRMALGKGTQTALARSAEERARIARTEALSGLLPQADARLLRYSQSINLATFGFTIPGQPPVVGPFNVIDGQIAAAMQLFNLAAIRHYQSVQQGVAASRFATEQAENDVAAAVARLYLLAQRAQTQIGSREADVALFERLLKVAEDEFTAGTGTRLDVAQARVQLARARQALLVARSDRQNAVLALLNAIGASESDDVTLTEIPAATAAISTVDTALAAARAALHEVEIEGAQRERDVEQDVRRALFALDIAQQRVAVARESAGVAEEALTVARDRRAAGYGSPVEVDRAQDAYRQAREDLIAAESDAAAAQFDLQHATGDIRRLAETRP